VVIWMGRKVICRTRASPLPKWLSLASFESYDDLDVDTSLARPVCLCAGSTLLLNYVNSEFSCYGVKKDVVIR
jgi:hypothetical protein